MHLRHGMTSVPDVSDLECTLACAPYTAANSDGIKGIQTWTKENTCNAPDLADKENIQVVQVHL